MQGILWFPPTGRRSVVGSLLLMLLGIGACDRPPRPPLGRAIDEDPSPPLSAPDRAAGTAASGPSPAGAHEVFQPWESWDAHFIRGEHVGFSHLQAEPLAGSTPRRIRYILRDQITLRRGSDLTTQLLTQESIERLDGTLESFNAELQMGSDVTTYQGVRRDGQLVITARSGTTDTTWSIPWQPDDRGLAAVQQSLRSKPMREGQSRQIRALLPMHYQPGVFRLQAVAQAAVPLLKGRTATLLEIKSQLQLSPEMTIDSVLWVDREGQIIKSLMPALELVSYRTDAETATAKVMPTKDLLAATAVRVDRVIDQPERVRFARYRVATTALGAAAGGPQELTIPVAAGQTVVASDAPGQQEVIVRAGVDDRDDLPPPTDADRRPSAIIDSGAPEVQDLLEKLAPQPSADRHAEAIRLAEAVRDYVTQKDFSRGFSSASQVVQSGSGDCTEHSVLLAAMLRARQIPARIAAGLVYMPSADGPVMAYHMWTLAYIEGQGWLPLDATLDQIPAAADRITLVTSDLATGDALGGLLPILRTIGKLRIEILEVKLNG